MNVSIFSYLVGRIESEIREGNRKLRRLVIKVGIWVESLMMVLTTHEVSLAEARGRVKEPEAETLVKVCSDMVGEHWKVGK